MGHGSLWRSRPRCGREIFIYNNVWFPHKRERFWHRDWVILPLTLVVDSLLLHWNRSNCLIASFLYWLRYRPHIIYPKDGMSISFAVATKWKTLFRCFEFSTAKSFATQQPTSQQGGSPPVSSRLCLIQSTKTIKLRWWLDWVMKWQTSHDLAHNNQRSTRPHVR